MYEPIRTKSVHSMAGPRTDTPHRSREEELDSQLAGYLTALLTVTDELGLDEAAERVLREIVRLRGAAPVRAATADDPGHRTELHRRAAAAAARALVVAESRADAGASELLAERLGAHEAALAEGQQLTGAH
ncbi:SCO4983 family protein [Streptomyces sp. DW26H14]|uniref:SCO4983 family protein n=1 Tax=Streptomyces sp. DW26H14 TaxID=3435395 RepID=UPI00403D6C51